MILHLVFFKFREPYGWQCIEAQQAEKLTQEHPAHIREIRGWSCGRNTAERAVAADFVVMGVFNTPAELAAYLVHPHHQQGVEQWKTIATWNVVDLDLNAQSTYFAGVLSGLAVPQLSTLIETH